MRIIRGHAGNRGRPRWIASCTCPNCHLASNAEALCMVRIVTSRPQHLRVDEKAKCYHDSLDAMNVNKVVHKTK